MRPQRINKAGLEIIKNREQLYLKAYLCPKAIGLMKNGKEPFYTIGWGHTGPEVHHNSEITRETAEYLLQSDCHRFEAAAIDLIKVELSSNQFSAIISFIFNVGIGKFARSTLLKKINSADILACPKEFMRWTKSDLNGNGIIEDGEELPGLIIRRKMESELFLTPDSV